MRIRTVDWKLTGACPLRCLHCYGPPKNVGSLPFASLLQVIDRFVKLGVQTVVLTGGEPLNVPRIGDLLRHLFTAGIDTAISTNGSLVERYLEEINRYAFSLNLSLDGSNPEIHARSRDDKQTFHDCLNALRYYQAYPKEKPRLLRVGTVYSKASAGDFLALNDLLEPFMDVISFWKIYELIDNDVQRDLRQPIIHDPSDFAVEMASLLHHSKFPHQIKVAYKSTRDKAYFMIDPAGQLVIPTDHNGVMSDVIVGNILEDDLDGLVAAWAALIHDGNYAHNHGWYDDAKP